MLDLSAEKAISLTAAAALITPARSGKKTHLSTLIRWITGGAKSPTGVVVRLEAARLGARWVTSREAIQRFSDALTPRLDSDAAPDQPLPRSAARQQRSSERAAKELAAVGI